MVTMNRAWGAGLGLTEGRAASHRRFPSQRGQGSRQASVRPQWGVVVGGPGGSHLWVNLVDWAVGGSRTACAPRRAGEEAETTCLRAAVYATMQSPVPHHCLLPLPQTQRGLGALAVSPPVVGRLRGHRDSQFSERVAGGDNTPCMFAAGKVGPSVFRVPREARPGKLS